MTPDLYVKIGDVTLQGLEIPESMPFGGTQEIVAHKLVGGTKVADAMGPFERDIEWSGTARGPNARIRMMHLDYLRAKGQAITLSWGTQSYTVLIKDFKPDFRAWYYIPYTITCEVIANLSNPVPTVDTSSLDDAMSADVAQMNALVAQINNPQLTGLMGTLQSAMSSVSSFVQATQSTINSVMAPLRAVQSCVSGLMATATGILGTVGAIGIPGVSNAIAKMNNAIASATQIPVLSQMTSILGRMEGNLGAVTGSASTIVQGGGNLYQMASAAYGEVSGWATIAQANGIADPQLTGINTVIVPKTAGNTGGVLAQ